VSRWGFARFRRNAIDGRKSRNATRDPEIRDASIIARASRSRGSSAHSTRSLLAKDGRIEFANLQIGFQLAYYRVRLFRLKAGGKGINVDTPRKAGGLLQRPVSHCLRCCAPLCIHFPALPRPSFPPPRPIVLPSARLGESELLTSM